MNTKIDWYKEVLELEPGSKVFFPLAKMLADDGRAAEAVTILRQGLDRHPDHLEAKLLCIELVLAVHGVDGGVVRDVERLADTMGAYPGFWQTWADILEDQDERDCACAVQFLAAHFQGNDVTWAEVLERGLKAVLGESSEHAVARPRPAAGARDMAATRVAAATVAAAFVEDGGEDEPEEDGGDAGASFAFSEAPQPFHEDDVPVSAFEDDMDIDGGGAILGADESRDDDVDDEADDGDESISVRTRTMAVLLEDQGDYSGALDIYKELLAAAEPGPRRDDLAQRIAGLTDKLSGLAKPDAGDKAASDTRPHDVADALKGKTKLMSTLEALASRLEARAAG
ncbi:MAG: tetratricopeptide repeat-containing protein [Desulfovibrionaceae bacterium]